MSRQGRQGKRRSIDRIETESTRLELELASAANPEEKVPLTHFRGVPSLKARQVVGSSDPPRQSLIQECVHHCTTPHGVPTFIYLNSENRRQSGPGSARRWIPFPDLHAAPRAHDFLSAGRNMCNKQIIKIPRPGPFRNIPRPLPPPSPPPLPSHLLSSPVCCHGRPPCPCPCPLPYPRPWPWPWLGLRKNTQAKRALDAGLGRGMG